MAVGVAGMVFIGPTPETIAALGDKVRTRDNQLLFEVLWANANSDPHELERGQDIFEGEVQHTADSWVFGTRTRSSSVDG